ncbi:MAG: ComEC/Rec2 family competence protein, partial [Candidatus Nanoarchaeia archaeon]
ICILIILFFLCKSFQEILKFFFSVLLGVLLSWNSSRDKPQTYVAQIGNGNCGAEIKAEIVDASAAGADLPWLPPPKPIKAKVNEIRFSSVDSWQKSDGLVAIYLPKNAPPLSYGDKIIAVGAFIKPATAVFDGDFDYSKYLSQRKIKRIFKCSTISIEQNTKSKFSAFKIILEFRNFCMRKICDGIPDDINKKMIAAIIFGCRQGIDQVSKKHFLLGGMIHIFAVSGIHVGMIATIVFFILRPLPFRIRHFALVPIIFLYVMTTGFQPSATRAGLMISLWSLMRAFFISGAALNSILIAGLLILVFNPMSLFDVGFQFSFIIVIFLILSWNFSKEIYEMLMEKRRFVPPSAIGIKFIFEGKLASFLIYSLCASFTAWLASLPLSIFYQGIIAPASVPANFASIPLVWLLFVFSFAKFAISGIPFFSEALSNVLNFLMSYIRWLAEISSKANEEQILFSPSILIICIYCLLLSFIFTARIFYIRVCLAGTLVVFIAGWIFYSRYEELNKTSVAIFYGGEGMSPMIVIAENGVSSIINIPSRETARSALNWLKKKGVGTINEIVFCAPTKEFLNSADFLISVSNVSKVSMSKGWEKSNFARKAAISSMARNCLFTETESNIIKSLNLRNSQKIQEYLIKLPPCFKNINQLLLKKLREGEWELEILQKRADIMYWQVPLQNKLKMKEIQIHERDCNQRLFYESVR